MDGAAALFGWMAWTLPVALFFAAVLALLAGMTLWQIRSPGTPRKGWLPMPTTRGDRLFIGLLCAAWTNLAWAGLTDMPQAVGAAIGFVLLLVVMRWG